MKKLVLLLFVSLFAFQSSNGQITIPETTLTSLIGSESTTVSYNLVTSTDLQPIVDAAGPNQTWDFSAIAAMDTFTITQRYIGLPATIPGAGDAAFMDADFAINVDADTGSVYLYQGIDGGNHINYGTVLVGDIDDDGMDDELSTINSPPSLIDVFPIEYQNTWSDSTSLSFAGLFVTSIIVTETIVDGWGTLVTPSGSLPALRINRTIRTSTPQVPDFQTTTTLLLFLTQEGVSASISINSDGSIVSAEYGSFGTDTGTDIERIDDSLPNSFALSQNYPNPFNPSTQISFSIPESSEVKLTVYTVTGTEVATLANGVYPVGNYEFTFDASNYASGLYLYRLETENFVETRLMTLVK